MFTFSHADLDGTYNSLIGRGAILQMIDPNDGQSSDPSHKSRHQITAVDDVLFQRCLPPASVGDIWRDETEIRTWKSIDTLPTLSLVTDWWQSQFTNYQPLAAEYRHRLTCGLPPESVTNLTLQTDINTITTNVWEWPQAIPCPHCGDWIQWHEDCYGPGHRSCRNGCKRRWQITRSSGAGRWTMERIKGNS
jgi:hypothetical protein